jgi:hypothetical protein
MKIKKRLKYKSTLPKADFSMNASNMNRAAAEETPAQGGGMGAGAALGVANGALDFVTSFAPKDNNDGIGISHKGICYFKRYILEDYMQGLIWQKLYLDLEL